MAHTPYHALNKRERQAYNARRQLLGLMGDLLRQAAMRMEKNGAKMYSVRLADRFYKCAVLYGFVSLPSGFLQPFEGVCVLSTESQVANLCVVCCLRCQSHREVCIYQISIINIIITFSSSSIYNN